MKIVVYRPSTSSTDRRSESSPESSRRLVKNAVQVSGKMRASIDVPADATEADILSAAKAHAKVVEFVGGKAIKREIYVKGRLVNLVV